MQHLTYSSDRWAVIQAPHRAAQNPCLLSAMLWSLAVAIIVVTVRWGTVQGQCSSGSPPCQLTCRCSPQNHENSCRAEVPSGCRSQGCQPGWSGDTCQRNNTVYKSTNSNEKTGILGSSGANGTFYMALAFDGSPNTEYRSNRQDNPYLWVKLPNEMYVYSMRITTRGTNTSTQNVQIHVSDSNNFTTPLLCYEGTITTTLGEYNIKCTRELFGRYVRIQVLAVTALIVREWEIYKCANFWFGDGCSRLCNCRNATQRCNQFSGHCASGCPDGYTGTDCYTACPVGQFGEGCQGACHCKNQSSCNKVDGTCDGQGCAPGYMYMEGNCQNACGYERFGEGCQGVCRCKNQASCNMVSGTCDGQGCAAGYTGDDCQEVKGNSTGAVIGGVCAGVVALVLVTLAILLYRKRFRPTSSRKQKREEIDFSDDAVNSRPVVPAVPAVQDARNHSMYANTGDIDLSKTVVRSQDFVPYVTKKLSEDNVLENEFEKLPSGLLEKVVEAHKENNAKKCRYRGLLPYDHTRVIMGVVDGDPSTDFINASYIHGYMKKKAFIASQGTTPVNINDFWRMIWEMKVGKIVMLTHLFENGKEKVKQYWPDQDVAEFGDISVETIDSQHFVDYSVRTLKVQQSTNVLMVTQFHYLDWKDHSAPRDTSGIIELREKINQTSSKLNGPVLVHCSAGVGRTGTYIAFDYLIRKLEAEPEVDIFQTVVELRHQRTQIVQTKEQYVFLHKVLRDAFLCRGSTITSDALMQKKLDPPSFRSKIQNEFRKLKQLKVPMDNSDFEGGLADENRKKNRDLRCIPNDMDRVWLSTNVPGRNGYVNAMSVPAECGNNRIIATQMPFGDTRIDFWRLVYEQNSTLVVLLNSLTKTDDRYWPGDNTPMEIGPFRISLVDETDGDALVIRKLSVVYNRMKNNPPHDVHLYCFTGWPEGQDVPTSPVDIVSLKAQVFAWQRRANAGPVIVQCRNGTDRSALYCVCDFLLDRLKSERSVNVLLTAKRFQTYFNNGIKSEAEYGFCYLVAEAYLNNFNVYANFSSGI